GRRAVRRVDEDDRGGPSPPGRPRLARRRRPRCRGRRVRPRRGGQRGPKLPGARAAVQAPHPVLRPRARRRPLRRDQP
ncbi:MAG: hypothetical protein AVDCRST_MAG59-192, partial [uncultured Thermomicrobiales bacterium]